MSYGTLFELMKCERRYRSRLLLDTSGVKNRWKHYTTKVGKTSRICFSPIVYPSPSSIISVTFSKTKF